MLQLVYISDASKPLNVDDMGVLCKQARRNNRHNEITGILVSKGDKFLQALEGPKEPVEEAFLRIISDDRHKNLRLLSRRIITKREFGEWELEHFEDPLRCADLIASVARLTTGAPESVRTAFRDFVAASR